MAFDGVTVAALCHELNTLLKDCRINKIAQPEDDEILFTIKGSCGQARLLMSASASLPLVYLTDVNKPSPANAPAFCMLLRKHLTNARILGVTQPGLERVINIDLEHRDELGDLVTKRLIIEIMGKHSNIIFTRMDGTIIDSIKHISAAVSSVREVLPGREYFLPVTTNKLNPYDVSLEQLTNALKEGAVPVFKGIYSNLTGVSPLLAQELCHRAGVDADLPTSALSDNQFQNIYDALTGLMADVGSAKFEPNIVYEGGLPVEYSALPMEIYGQSDVRSYESISEVLRNFYAERNIILNMRQRSADLRRVVTTALERNVKKYDIQIKQMQDTEKRDKYKIWGELLNAYGYSVEEGARSVTVLNYYNNENETIPLDETLSPAQNAQKYYDRYNKLKRTYEALSKLTVEVSMEISHLESVLTSLDIARSEDDLNQIREELMESGVIHRKANSKKVKILSKPFHYVTEDGFHIYVGKNNLQNDELTFKLANGNDWWFHSKKIPGSHVILKTEGRDVPDKVFEIAAAAAAYYCKGAEQAKVEIDYVKRKEVKKPAGAKPGFVVYYTNFSMSIEPGLAGLTLVD